MSNRISVVIQTLNEEKNIDRAVNSVKWADEVLVCDMYSEDHTVELAKKLGAKVVFHKRAGFVEPARNFAISKASGDWVLILDADEEIPSFLADKIREIASRPSPIEVIEIPRKNIIFGHWMKASMWWPDYNIRLFKKGKVKWGDKIHRPPEVIGEALKLPAQEEGAVVHHHYHSIDQFISRMNRYTDIQAKELIDSGYKFFWPDLIHKPVGEFLGRFFANKGFQDGVHGLALSLLQSFSIVLLYLKVWEGEKFADQSLDFGRVKDEVTKSGAEIGYWLKFGNLSPNPFKKFWQKVKG